MPTPIPIMVARLAATVGTPVRCPASPMALMPQVRVRSAVAIGRAAATSPRNASSNTTVATASPSSSLVRVSAVSRACASTPPATAWIPASRAGAAARSTDSARAWSTPRAGTSSVTVRYPVRPSALTEPSVGLGGTTRTTWGSPVIRAAVRSTADRYTASSSRPCSTCSTTRPVVASASDAWAFSRSRPSCASLPGSRTSLSVGAPSTCTAANSPAATTSQAATVQAGWRATARPSRDSAFIVILHKPCYGSL